MVVFGWTKVAGYFVASGSPTLNQPDQDHDHGNDEQDVNETAHSIGGHHPEQPHENENDGNSFEHKKYVLLNVCLSRTHRAGRKLMALPIIKLAIPPSSIHMDLSVGDPVKNREKSEPIEFDALIPKMIRTIPSTSSAIPIGLFIIFALSFSLSVESVCLGHCWICAILRLPMGKHLRENCHRILRKTISKPSHFARLGHFGLLCRVKIRGDG